MGSNPTQPVHTGLNSDELGAPPQATMGLLLSSHVHILLLFVCRVLFHISSGRSNCLSTTSSSLFSLSPNVCSSFASLAVRASDFIREIRYWSMEPPRGSSRGQGASVDVCVCMQHWVHTSMEVSHICLKDVCMFTHTSFFTKYSTV